MCIVDCAQSHLHLSKGLFAVSFTTIIIYIGRTAERILDSRSSAKKANGQSSARQGSFDVLILYFQFFRHHQLEIFLESLDFSQKRAKLNKRTIKKAGM